MKESEIRINHNQHKIGSVRVLYVVYIDEYRLTPISSYDVA